MKLLARFGLSLGGDPAESLAYNLPEADKLEVGMADRMKGFVNAHRYHDPAPALAGSL